MGVATQSAVSIACCAARQERRLKSTVTTTATATAALAQRRNRASVSGPSISPGGPPAAFGRAEAPPSFFGYAITAIDEESSPHEHGDRQDYQRAYYDPGEVNIAHQGFQISQTSKTRTGNAPASTARRKPVPGLSRVKRSPVAQLGGSPGTRREIPETFGCPGLAARRIVISARCSMNSQTYAQMLRTS